MDMCHTHTHKDGEEDKWTTFTCSKGQVKKRQLWVDYNMQTLRKNTILVPLLMCLASPTCRTHNNATHLVTPTKYVHTSYPGSPHLSSPTPRQAAVTANTVCLLFTVVCLSGLLLSSVPLFFWLQHIYKASEEERDSHYILPVFPDRITRRRIRRWNDKGIPNDQQHKYWMAVE